MQTQNKKQAVMASQFDAEALRVLIEEFDGTATKNMGAEAAIVETTFGKMRLTPRTRPSKGRRSLVERNTKQVRGTGKGYKMQSALVEPAARKAYVLGGNAKFTVVGKTSGKRFTYQVVKHNDVHFVSVLVGPDNSSDFLFLGTIFPSGKYRHSEKSKISHITHSATSFDWLWQHLETEKMEMWHSGTCSRCNRELTDPESIKRGLGPVCAEKSL